MNSELLSQPYILIGLNLKTDRSNPKNSITMQAVFTNMKDCEDFLVQESNNNQIVVIVSGQLPPDQVNKLKTYSKIDSIYLFSEEHQYKCIYTKSIARQYCQTFVTIFRKYLFIIGLAIALLLAVLFPHIGASGGPLHAEYTFKWGCMIGVFFLGGLSLPTKTLTREILHFRLHVFIQVFSFVLIPLVVYGICLLLAQTSFNRILIGGMISMACTSTTISSNAVMTKNAGGNEPAALLNSVIGNVLGIFISPALLWLFMLNDDVNALHQQYGAHDYLQALFNLTVTVLLPLIVGQIIHFLWTEKIMWAKTNFYFAELNTLLILILIWLIFCDLVLSGSFETINKTDLVIVIVLNALFYIGFSLLAMFFARLPNICICRKQELNGDQQALLLKDHQKSKTWIERCRFSREDTVAIMFCAATKTVIKGVSLINAVNSTNNQDLIAVFSLPLIFYYVEQLFFGALAVFLLQRWLKSGNDTNQIELIEK